MAAKGLLVMDVDSTLIEEEVIDLLREKAGMGDKISEITAAAMSGEIDFKVIFERKGGFAFWFGHNYFCTMFTKKFI
jgi:phosphoserine phosphatase (EC 3.1.3.3)